MTKPQPLLQTVELVKRYGGLIATNHLNFEVLAGEAHAIIGPNGAGKTTLVAQLSGELKPTEGAIFFGGDEITHLPPNARALRGLARSFQITTLCLEFTALENVFTAMYARTRQRYNFWGQVAVDEDLNKVGRRYLEEVGLGDRMNVVASQLAHGEQRQLEVAVALATEPRILLLDEPMAGMGRQESAAMVELLLRLKQRYTMVLVEHDMDAVFQIADRISVLVYGRCIATGTPEETRANPTVREAYLGEEAGFA
jgi:branched-chain amino acid transport system ATP-binding protein